VVNNLPVSSQEAPGRVRWSPWSSGRKGKETDHSPAASPAISGELLDINCPRPKRSWATGATSTSWRFAGAGGGWRAGQPGERRAHLPVADRTPAAATHQPRGVAYLKVAGAATTAAPSASIPKLRRRPALPADRVDRAEAHQAWRPRRQGADPDQRQITNQITARNLRQAPPADLLRRLARWRSLDPGALRLSQRPDADVLTPTGRCPNVPCLPPSPLAAQAILVLKGR